MVSTILLLTIVSVFERSIGQIFEEPPLCGKSVITNTRQIKYTRLGELRNGSDSRTLKELTVDYLPYVASVQRFDVDLKDDGDIFDKRLSGAFVGTILGPTVVLVSCRCVARHMGPVGGDEMATWEARLFGVMAGTPWDYSPVDGTVGQIRFTSQIVVHPKCDLRPSLFLWDLAVMIMELPFELIQGIVEAAPIPRSPTELRKSLEDAASRRLPCFTAAWGWAFNGHKPKNLHLKLHPLLVQKFDRCNQSSADYLAAHILPTDIHLCVETAASFLRLQRTGDIGSPLLGFLRVNETTKSVQYVVIGIKSEEDDATPDGFSLFTRLDIDLDWLWNIKRNPPDPRGKASVTNITSLQVLLILSWIQI